MGRQRILGWGATGIVITDSNSSQEASTIKKESTAEDAEQMKLLRAAITNGLVTFAHATLSAVESSTVQTLLGKLVITQSQAAHREIAELLKELTDE